MIADNLRKQFSDLWNSSSEDNWIPGHLGNQPAGGLIDVNGYPKMVYVRLGYTGENGIATAYDAVGVAKVADTFVRMRRENGKLVIREASAYAAGSGGSGGGGATNLNALTDVTLASPANGQTLQYNASAGQWVNVVPPGGAGGAPSPHPHESVHHTGQLNWSSVNKSGSSLADITTRDHGLLTNVTVDQHHKRSHNIITGDGDPGAVHTVVGAQYDVVGLSATNALGILASSSNPGSTQKIIHTDSTGGISLGSGLFAVAPGSHQVTFDGTLLVINATANTMIVGAASTFNGSAVFNTNATFNNGVLKFNTDPQVYADIDFMGVGVDRNITAQNSLHIQPKIDLYLESRPTGYVDPIFPNAPTSPVSRGNIVFPDDQSMRTPTFNEFIAGIDGWTIQWLGGFKHQLTISNLLVDNLFAHKFTADEARVQRGEWFLTRSYGIVHADFLVPAVGSTVDVWFEEAPGLGSAKLFVANNWIEFRTIDWGTGLVIQTVWFQAVDFDGAATSDYITRTAATEDTPSLQQWRLRRKDGGFTGATIHKGEVGADFGLPTTSMTGGQLGQGVIYMSSLYEPDFGPFIEMQIFDSIQGTSPHFQNKVRMGNLQTAVGFTSPVWGFAAGNDLSILPSSGNFSGVVIDAVSGAKFYNTDIDIMTGTTVVTNLNRTYGMSLLNNAVIHGDVKRVIAWYDDLSNIPSAFATGKIGTWGNPGDRRLQLSSYGTTQASVSLDATGGTENVGIRLVAGGWDGKTGGVTYIGTQWTHIGFTSDIGFPSAHVMIGSDTNFYTNQNLHVYDNSGSVGQNTGITMETLSPGDPVFHWKVGTRIYTAGIDISDGGRWKLVLGWDLTGAVPFIQADPTTGQVIVNGLIPGSAISGMTASNGIVLVGSDIQTDSSVVRTSISVTAGVGLAGGGALSSSQQLRVLLPSQSGLLASSSGLTLDPLIAGTGLSMGSDHIMHLDPSGYVSPSFAINTAATSGLKGGGTLATSPLNLAVDLATTEPGLTITDGLTVDGSVARVTTFFNTAATSGLQGGGNLGSSHDLSIRLAPTNPGLSIATGLQVDSSVARTTKVIGFTAPITGGGPLSGTINIGLSLASPSGLIVDVGGDLAIDNALAGNGLLMTGKVLSVNPAVFVPVGVSIIAGDGLTGGGDLSGSRTLNIVGSPAIIVNDDNIDVLLGANPGLTKGAGLAVASTLAGTGLLWSPGVISVNPALFVSTSRSIIAGLGLTGTHDLTTDVTLNMANADGTLVLAADDAKVNQAYAFNWTAPQSWSALAPTTFNALSTFNLGATFAAGSVLFQAGATFNAGVFQFNTNPKVSANLDFIGADRNITASANLLVLPVGNLTLDPTSTFVYPGSNYKTNLGGYARKWATLFVAEIYAETLVASSVMATIGGRIIVAPSSSLVSDINSSVTTIDLKHQFAAGTYIYLETINGTLPQMESIKLNTTGVLTSGFYRYTGVTRGSGGAAVAWTAGDSVVSFGSAIGDGYIDHASVKTAIDLPLGGQKIGPTVTVYSRTSTATWKDLAPVVSMGQLRGFIGIATSTFGFAAGNDLTKSPSNGFSGLAATATGMTMYNTNLLFYNGVTLESAFTPTVGVAFSLTSALGAYNSITWRDDPLSIVAARNMNIGAYLSATNNLAGQIQVVDASGTNSLSLYAGKNATNVGSGLSLSDTGIQLSYNIAANAIFYIVNSNQPTRAMIGVNNNSSWVIPSTLEVLSGSSANDGTVGLTITNTDIAGDALLHFRTLTTYAIPPTIAQNWTVGVDRSNSNSFNITPGTDFTSSLGFTILPSGLVGIGTLLPTSLLDMKGTGAAQAVVGTTTDTSGSLANFIAATNGSDVLLYNRVSDTLATATRYGVSTGGAAEIIGSGAGLTSLMIGTNTLNVPIIFGQASAERMRIDTGGLVGIGPQASSPTYQLHVWNNQNAPTGIMLQNDTAAASAVSLLTLMVSGGAYAQVVKRSASVTSITGIIGPGDLYIYNTLAGDIAIRNNNASGLIKMAVGSGTTPDLFIDNTHNIGFNIPTTELEAWNTNYRAIEGFRSSIMFHNVTSSGLFMIDNMYYDGAWKLKSAAAASYMSLGAGTLSYGTAASGAADLDVQTPGLLTTKFVVANSGNVGILNTSPGTYLQIGATDPTVTTYPGLWIVPGTTIAGIELQNSAGGHITLFAHSNGNNYIGSASNTPLVLRTNNLDRMTIAAAGAVSIAGLLTVPTGINLGDSTLAVYDHNTAAWTPVLTTTGTTPSIAYTTRTYSYTKIGTWTFVRVHMVLGTVGTGGTGNVRINMPFAPLNAVAQAIPGYYNNFPVCAVSDTTSSLCVLYYSGGGAIPISSLASGQTLIITGCFQYQ